LWTSTRVTFPNCHGAVSCWSCLLAGPPSFAVCFRFPPQGVHHEQPPLRLAAPVAQGGAYSYPATYGLALHRPAPCPRPAARAPRAGTAREGVSPMIHFRCRSCRAELEIVNRKAGKTVYCPECGQKTRVPEIEQQADDYGESPKKQVQVPTWVASIITAVLIVVVILIAVFHKKKEKSPEVIAENVTAQELFADYQANSVAADRRYKGQFIRILGTITQIGRDILGSPYVLFVVRPDGIFGVQCLFAG